MAGESSDRGEPSGKGQPSGTGQASGGGIGQPSAMGPASGTGLAGRRVVLIVDDHEDTRDLIAEVFAWRGAHAVRARSVEQALDLLRGVQVHAIVTDYAMPGMDGLTFVRRLRASEHHASTPIVMLSGQASDEVRREILALGGRYLSKPADLEALLAAVDSLLARSNAA